MSGHFVVVGTRRRRSRLRRNGGKINIPALPYIVTTARGCTKTTELHCATKSVVDERHLEENSENEHWTDNRKMNFELALL